jgi:hypothetical protein
MIHHERIRPPSQITRRSTCTCPTASNQALGLAVILGKREIKYQD